MLNKLIRLVFHKFSKGDKDHPMERKVILVDKEGREIGTKNLVRAHVEGSLHRSFGVFIINSQDQMLLQKRHTKKIHSGGLWCNACSSHPNPGEKTIEAAHRRLREEMGIDCNLQEAFTILYQVNFEKNHIQEHEFGHVFIGFSDAVPQPNEEEIEAYRWVKIDQLSRDIIDSPQKYAHWFKQTFDSVTLFVKEIQKITTSTRNSFQSSVKGLCP